MAWKISITNPMPLTLAFTGKVSGDSMSGEMGIGPMGSFPFTGIAGVSRHRTSALNGRASARRAGHFHFGRLGTMAIGLKV